MLREGGYARIFFPEGNKQDVANLGGTRVKLHGSLYEASTFTCHHCNSVVHVPPKADVNYVGFCRSCMKPICNSCTRKPCIPFAEKLAQIEARAEKGSIYER
jgi:hypothetical protein